jgi:type III secretion protein V
MNAELRPRSFAVRIHHLLTLPRVGLDPAICLVDDEADALELRGIEATAALQPANRRAAALVGKQHAADLEAAGNSTWDAFDYIVLCIAADLREHAWRVIDVEFVNETLRLVSTVFPATVQAARGRITERQLTRVLRGLLAEQVSIRNVRQILEILLDYDVIVIDPSRYIIFDDRIPVAALPDDGVPADAARLVAFVRTGMKRFISHKYTRGQSTLQVFLVAPDLERAIARGTLSSLQHMRMLEDIRERLKSAAGDALALLTSVEVREPLRALTRADFPRLPVLAYQELSPDMNIQPLARITIAEPAA